MVQVEEKKLLARVEFGKEVISIDIQSSEDITVLVEFLEQMFKKQQKDLIITTTSS